MKGCSQRTKRLGNKFLGHIREVDAIVHVVRCFENANIVHVDGHIDPVSDIDTINTELILSDMEMLERKIQRTSKAAQGRQDSSERTRSAAQSQRMAGQRKKRQSDGSR